MGDYIGLDQDDQTEVSKHLGRRDRVTFASKISRYNRKFLSARRDLITTETNLFMIGRRPVGSGDEKNKKKKYPPGHPLETYVEEKIELQMIESIVLR